MLTFVGLGLYDERSVTLEGRDALRKADRVFAEFYTSTLTGTTLPDLEAFHGVDIEVRDRTGIEGDPGPILDAAEGGDVVFLVGGDPFVSTTHVDLRLRARERGIDTGIVHGTTAQAAASSLTGLQNYRFGKATTLPFPRDKGSTATDAASADQVVDPSTDDIPASVIETIEANRSRGLHTLVYLDITADGTKYMTADLGASLLAPRLDAPLGVAIGRAGSPDPLVVADSLRTLAGQSLGDPLHLLVIPGDLHILEQEALRAFAGAPLDRLE